MFTASILEVPFDRSYCQNRGDYHNLPMSDGSVQATGESTEQLLIYIL